VRRWVVGFDGRQVTEIVAPSNDVDNSLYNRDSRPGACRQHRRPLYPAIGLWIVLGVQSEMPCTCRLSTDCVKFAVRYLDHMTRGRLGKRGLYRPCVTCRFVSLHIGDVVPAIRRAADCVELSI